MRKFIIIVAIALFSSNSSAEEIYQTYLDCTDSFMTEISSSTCAMSGNDCMCQVQVYYQLTATCQGHIPTVDGADFIVERNMYGNFDQALWQDKILSGNNPATCVDNFKNPYSPYDTGMYQKNIPVTSTSCVIGYGALWEAIDYSGTKVNPITPADTFASIKADLNYLCPYIIDPNSWYEGYIVHKFIPELIDTRTPVLLDDLPNYPERSIQYLPEIQSGQSVTVQIVLENNTESTKDNPRDFYAWVNVYRSMWLCYGGGDSPLFTVDIPSGQTDVGLSSYSCPQDDWYHYTEVYTTEDDDGGQSWVSGGEYVDSDDYNYYWYSGTSNPWSLWSYDVPLADMKAAGLCNATVQLGILEPYSLDHTEDLEYINEFVLKCGCSATFDFTNFLASVDSLSHSAPFAYLFWLKDFYTNLKNYVNSDVDFNLTFAGVTITISRLLIFNLRDLMYVLFAVSLIKSVVNRYILGGIK